MKKINLIILCIVVAFAFCGCHFDVRGTNEEQSSTAQKKRITEEQTVTKADIDAREAGSIVAEGELEELDSADLFYYEEIPDYVFARMDGVSFGEDCVVSREELRYVRVLHMGFDGKTHIGELVCHRDLADDLTAIFLELYAHAYPIEKMLLIDVYHGDDEASMEDNNTSCFNFRPVPGSDHLSQHAYGRAIDINPLYNPYITEEGYSPANAGEYVDRTQDTPNKIDTDDLCYQLFTEHGFFWGGNWNSVKDYQHFQKKQGE